MVHSTVGWVGSVDVKGCAAWFIRYLTFDEEKTNEVQNNNVSNSDTTPNVATSSSASQQDFLTLLACGGKWVFEMKDAIDQSS